MNDPVRVLHVDDDAIGDLVATYLEREHSLLDVTTVIGTGTALDRLDEAPFDCVVSDYDMPGRTDIELLEAVRERFGDVESLE